MQIHTGRSSAYKQNKMVLSGMRVRIVIFEVGVYTHQVSTLKESALTSTSKGYSKKCPEEVFIPLKGELKIVPEKGTY
jgi:hypothetical protein